MTILELQVELGKRDAMIQIHRSPAKWTVIMYAAEDPEATLLSCSNVSLETAVRGAFKGWDGEHFLDLPGDGSL